MGFLEFQGEYQLELFLTDRGKQKMMEMNGKGLADLLGGSIQSPSGIPNGDGHFYLSDNDFDYETTLYEPCEPVVSPWIQGNQGYTGLTGPLADAQSTPSNRMPCFFQMPDVRGQRYFTTNHCTWYTGETALTGMSLTTNVYVFYDQVTSYTDYYDIYNTPKTSPPHLAAQAHFYSAATAWFTTYQAANPAYRGKIYHFVMDDAKEDNTIPDTYGGHGRYLRWAAFPAYGILAGVKNSPPPGRVDAAGTNLATAGFWPAGSNWVSGDGTGILETTTPDNDIFCIFFMGSSESYASDGYGIPALGAPLGVATDWTGLDMQAGLGNNYQQDWEYFAGKSANNWTAQQTEWAQGNTSLYVEGEGALDFYRNTPTYSPNSARGGFIGLIFPIATTGGTGCGQYSSFNLHVYGALEAGNSSGNGTVTVPNTDNPNLCVDYGALTISNPYYSNDLEGPGNLPGLKNLGFVADLTQSFSTNGTACSPSFSALTGSNYTFGFGASTVPQFLPTNPLSANTPFIVDTFTGTSNFNFLNQALTGSTTGRTTMFISTACTICYCLPAVFRQSTCPPVTTVSTTIGPPCPNPPCDPDPEIVRLCDGSTYSTGGLRAVAGPIQGPVQPAAPMLPLDPLQLPGWVLGYEDCMELEIVMQMMPVAYLSRNVGAERIDYDIELNAIIPKKNPKDSLSYYWLMEESLVYDYEMKQYITRPCKDLSIGYIMANGGKTLDKRFYLNDLRKKIDDEHYWQRDVEEFCLYCVVNYNNQQLLTKKMRIRVSGDDEYGWKFNIKGS